MEQRNHSLLTEGLKQWNVTLSEQQLHQLDCYYELLIEKNKVMNLTAITEYEEVLLKHFLDSISLVQAIPLNRNLRVLDLGTGAGFPGIPLKIAFPQLEPVLMDSLNKRVLFLQDVIAELGLTGITAVHARAEEAAGKAEYREQFDLCVSRAVARLVSLSEFCVPFVKKGGYFIPYKSGEIDEECKEAKYALSELGVKQKKIISFSLPNSDMERTLLVFEKTGQTPKKYPRSGGKPLKQPLIEKSRKK